MSDVSNKSRQLSTLNKRYRSLKFACYLDTAPKWVQTILVIERWTKVP